MLSERNPEIDFHHFRSEEHHCPKDANNPLVHVQCVVYGLEHHGLTLESVPSFVASGIDKTLTDMANVLDCDENKFSFRAFASHS